MTEDAARQPPPPAATPKSRAALVPEAAAVAATVLCVWLMGNEDVLGWPVGIAGAVLYGIVFFRARLFSDVLLQGFFLVTSVIGWIQWTPEPSGDTLAIAHIALVPALVWGATAAASIATLGFCMGRYARAALPYWDATITVLSVVAQCFLVVKIVEAWVLWIAVDALMIGVARARGLTLTCVLYAVLLANAVKGLVQWL